MSERAPDQPKKRSRWRVWLIPVVAFGLALIAGIVLFGKLRGEVWATYSDGAGVQSAIEDEKARPVLWQDPEPQTFMDDTGAETGTLEAAFSADGTTMVLVHWDKAGRNADLFRSHWDGRRWSQPEAISSLNTKASERSPALSRDGRYLYFSSDREGGVGGYDLYVSRWDGTAWTGVEALPDTVNTKANELGPAISADGTQLYFSSDRTAGGAEDIFLSMITMPEETPAPVVENENSEKTKKRPKNKKDRAEVAQVKEEKKLPLAPMPEFGNAAAVDDLNSKAAEVQAAMTTRGDHVFLASDRDRSKKSGFKLYLSRVIDGEAQAPEEIDLYIEEGDVTDPAVRMEGFDLLFSVGEESKDPATGYRLFHSTTREVVGYTDRSRWEQFKELMNTIAWWIVLALAALIGLIYILEKWQDMTSLFHKCLAGSAVLHLVALLLAMLLLIATTIEKEDARQEEEVLVSIDALAQEELALESIPEETTLTETTTNLETEKVESEFGAPGFEAQNEAQPAPEAAQTTKEAVLVEAQPTNAQTSDAPMSAPSEESSVLKDLTAAALPEIEQFELEERDPSEPQEVADTSTEQFEPAPAMVETEKVEAQMTTETAVGTPPEASEVTELQPSEPLVEQEKVAEFVESSASESKPVEQATPADAPPLPSEMLSALPDSAFVNSLEDSFEERDPEEAQASDAPVDSSQEMFDPGQAASNLATEQSASGETASDTAETSPTSAADVAESARDAGAAPIEALASEIIPSAADLPLPTIEISQALPESSLLDPGAPVLEEPGAQTAEAPAEVTKDLFDPGTAAPNLATAQAEGTMVVDAAVTSAEATTVVRAADLVSTSAVAKAQASEPASPTMENLTPSNLARATLPEVSPVNAGAPKLEEGGGDSGGTPADPTKDIFKPDQAVPNLTTTPSMGQVASGSAVTATSTAEAVSSAELVTSSALTEPQSAPSAASPSINTLPPSLPGALPQVTLVDPGAPKLEEPGEGSGHAPADPTKDLFKASQSVPGLVTQQATGSAVGDSAVAHALAGGVVVEATRDTSGSTAMSPRGLVSSGGLPELGGESLASSLTDPGLLPEPALPGELEAPAGPGPRGMADLIKKQRGKPGIDTIKQMGGTEASEGSVGAAMEWLSKNQEADGRWDTRKHGAKINHDLGGTGLALLCFYGWGERHDIACKYQTNVRSALDWLVTQQRKDGYLGGAPGMMYSHAISTIALCEAYGVTKDQKLRQPAKRAIAYTLSAQSEALGGWRYSPGNGSDTSVTGWQYMALHSALMAGLEVPEEAFAKARGFLDRVGSGKYGGLYGYQKRNDISRAMVATGMFCRQLDLVPPGDPKMLESLRLLKRYPMKASKPDLYYVYYATLALYQHQGPVWTDWNKQLQEVLPLIQKKTGATTGSWDPSSSMAGEGGRVISTALATLSLEVYYRLLPMYGFRNAEAEAPEKKVRGE